MQCYLIKVPTSLSLPSQAFFSASSLQSAKDARQQVNVDLKLQHIPTALLFKSKQFIHIIFLYLKKRKKLQPFWLTVTVSSS